MALTQVSALIAEMRALRETVTTYERVTRSDNALLRQRVADCLTVSRGLAHRLLVLEGNARGE